MANRDIAPSTTGTTLATQDINSLRHLWNKGALIGEEEEDFFQQFEGSSERMPVWTENDTSLGKGQKKTFTTTSGYYGEGKYGEGLFNVPADYEQDDISSYDVLCDFLRNASSRSVRADEYMGMRDELTNMVPIKLGKWLGRTKKDQIMGLAIHKLPNENRIYASGKTKDTLSTADALSWDDIVTAGAAMKPLGGEPYRMSKDGMNDVLSQLFIPSETAALSLRLDPDYKTLIGNAGVRGDSNNLFKGGYPNIDGHTIAPHNQLNHSGKGAVGSFLAPEGYLGVPLTGDNTVQRTLSGGGLDNTAGTLTGTGAGFPLWFKYFPGHAYLFVDTGAIAQNVGPHYAIIYNTSGANAGKWGAIRYTTGNNGNAIVALEHLAAANGAFGKTTLTGSTITWSGAINTDQWDSGAMIFPCNAKGVPYGHTMVLGAGAIIRAYGMWRAKRTEEVDNGEFLKRTYITSVFGQSFRKDRKGRVPAALLLTTAIQRPGINLPVIA